MPQCAILTLATGLAFLARTAFAADIQESAIHAAFTLNFARFTEWPTGTLLPDRVIDLCFLSTAEPVGRDITAHQDKLVQGQLVRFRRGVRIADLNDCDVVYLGEQDEYRMQEVLRELAGHPVLTVGGIRGFAQAGGMIGLYRQEDKIRFEVNLDAVNRSGLKLSAQLLKLARIVGTGDKH